MTTGSRGQFGAIFEAGTTLGLGSAELLRRFVATRDEAAFAAIVARHGPMVLATCRRMLGNRADADDAFQATFLVLARQAGSIAHADRLGPWLHGVARHVARRARTLADRRRRVEGAESAGAVATVPPRDDAGELRPLLDEELARLPEKYRVPLVLCYLEGLTHDEAADQLNWPVGTVRSRLAGGRDRLRSRLARRGYAPGALAVLAPATLPTAAVSLPLQAATLRLVFATAKEATATSAAALLAQGALTSMLITKIQAVAAFLAVAFSVGAVGVVAAQPGPQYEAGAKTPSLPPPVAAGDEGQRLAREKLDEARKDAVIAQLQVKLLELQLKLAEKEAAPQPKPAPPPAQTPFDKPFLELPRKPGGIALPSSGKILICPPEGNRATMVDTLTGVRKTYRDPGTVARLAPFIYRDMVGLQAEGPKITQVVAYCRTEDEWYAKDLIEPIGGKIVPIMTDNLVHYRVGRHVYAFSDRSRRWGVLELKEPLPPVLGPVEANGECLIVREGDTTHVFNYQSGDWSHLNEADFR